jgi:hypothetical protein
MIRLVYSTDNDAIVESNGAGTGAAGVAGTALPNAAGSGPGAKGIGNMEGIEV